MDDRIKKYVAEMRERGGGGLFAEPEPFTPAIQYYPQEFFTNPNWDNGGNKPVIPSTEGYLNRDDYANAVMDANGVGRNQSPVQPQSQQQPLQQGQSRQRPGQGGQGGQGQQSFNLPDPAQFPDRNAYAQAIIQSMGGINPYQYNPVQVAQARVQAEMGDYFNHIFQGRVRSLREMNPQQHQYWVGALKNLMTQRYNEAEAQQRLAVAQFDDAMRNYDNYQSQRMKPVTPGAYYMDARTGKISQPMPAETKKYDFMTLRKELDRITHVSKDEAENENWDLGAIKKPDQIDDVEMEHFKMAAQQSGYDVTDYTDKKGRARYKLIPTQRADGAGMTGGRVGGINDSQGGGNPAGNSKAINDALSRLNSETDPGSVPERSAVMDEDLNRKLGMEIAFVSVNGKWVPYDAKTKQPLRM